MERFDPDYIVCHYQASPLHNIAQILTNIAAWLTGTDTTTLIIVIYCAHLLLQCFMYAVSERSALIAGTARWRE